MLFKYRENDKKRCLELIVLLNNWQYERYKNNRDVVPLEIYDQHFSELEKLEKYWGFSFDNSPTNRVSSIFFKKEDFNKSNFRREIPMLSLENAYSEKDLDCWIKKIEKKINRKIQYKDLCWEWKIDGLSASAIYKNGNLVSLTTRGDGYSGEELISNYKIIYNLPKSIDFLGNLEVRGEIFMNKRDFEILNIKMSESKRKEFSNARNLASGILRTTKKTTLDQDIFSLKKLNFLVYRVVNFDNLIERSHFKNLENIKKLGFSISVCNFLEEYNSVSIFNEFNKLDKKRDELSFDSDGIVIKVDDYNFQEILGNTSRFPKWSIAFKFEAESTYSKLLDIKSMVSCKGRINYIAKIEPVFLKGSNISSVTLHNYGFIRNKKLEIGDELVIVKSGDIIPTVSDVIKLNSDSNSVWKPSEFCISCKSQLDWDEKVNFQICNNDFCPEKEINKLLYFVSKNGLDAKNFGISIVKRLFENKIVKKRYDFFFLKDNVDIMLNIKGFDNKLIEKLLSSIDKSREINSGRFLSSFSIPLLGLIKANKLMEHYISITELIEDLNNNKLEKIVTILGKKTKESVEKFWKLNNLEIITTLENVKIVD